MGGRVKDFEDAVSKFIGCKEVIATNTGTTAMHLALDILDLQAGDEVLVPSLTFIATIQVIIQSGGTPVFCDVEGDTLNISIEDLKNKITSRTKVIMPVHYRGLPCNMEQLLDIAHKNNLTVVEDAAHAFGSKYLCNGGTYRNIGSFGHLSCFSFDPIKIITCGEGGAVCTNNTEWAERIRKKRILGIDKDAWSRYKNKRSWFYDVVDTGYRYHMSNINAAIGIKQMEKISEFISKRNALSKSYDILFSAPFFNEKLKTLKSDYNQSAMFTYIIKVLNKQRDSLMDHLKSKQIITGVHYIPNHYQTICKNYNARNLKNTEEVAEQILTLPLYYDLKDNDITTVFNSIKEFYEK